MTTKRYYLCASELSKLIIPQVKKQIVMNIVDVASLMTEALERNPQGLFEVDVTGDILTLYVYTDGDPVRWLTDSEHDNRRILIKVENATRECIDEVKYLVNKYPNTTEKWREFYAPCTE